MLLLSKPGNSQGACCKHTALVFIESADGMPQQSHKLQLAFYWFFCVKTAEISVCFPPACHPNWSHTQKMEELPGIVKVGFFFFSPPFLLD